MSKRGESKVEYSRTNLYLIAPEDITVIGYDTDDKDDHILYDERVADQEPDAEFVQTIIDFGVLDPITVRRNGGEYEVVAGRRRVIGARLANLKLKKEKREAVKIPCVVTRTTEDRMFEQNIITNMHRKAATTMQCARMANKHVEVLKRTVAQVASRFNVSRQSVNTWLKLCELCPEVQDAIDAEEFSATYAIDAFYGKSFEQQKAKLDRLRNKTERKPSNGRPRGPSRPTLRKVVDEISGVVDSGVDDEFIRGLRFALGDISAEEAGVERFIPKKKAKKSAEA